MRKISVLIVDDSEDDRYILTRQLQETKLNVSIFEKENGKEALDFFESYHEHKDKYPDDFPPLVVFLDINMPLVDGFSFLESFTHIRKKFNIDTSFIMMFTSSDREEEKEKAFSYDFVRAFLTKGQFSTEELTKKLEEILI